MTLGRPCNFIQKFSILDSIFQTQAASAVWISLLLSQAEDNMQKQYIVNNLSIIRFLSLKGILIFFMRNMSYFSCSNYYHYFET
jgi:hypothetical protein